jgi:hypothetical protein
VDDFAFGAADFFVAFAPPEDFAFPPELEDEDLALGREEDFVEPDREESESRTPATILAPALVTASAPSATVLPIERRTLPAPPDDFFPDFALLLLFLP